MVLVCNDPDFVFLKTTKAAGTSIEMALQTYCMQPGQDIVEHTPVLTSSQGIVGARGPFHKGVAASKSRWKFWQKHGWYNHMPAWKRDKLGKHRFATTAKIASVRDPFDRMVSQFHFFDQKKSTKLSDFSELHAAFRDYVLSDRWDNDFEIVSIDGRLVIDHFIRKENVREDLRKLSDALGLDLSRLVLPHTKNWSANRKNRSTAEYFDKDTIGAGSRRMAWVFENFDYPDQPLEAHNSDQPTEMQS